MRNSSAPNKLRLLNPWALLLVSSAVGGLLWFNFQDEKVFAPGDKAPDQVSVSYAQLLLAAHPEDDELRLRLVEQLIQLGDYKAANTHLDQWPQPNANLQAFYREAMQAFQLPVDTDPVPLLKRFDALDKAALSVPQLSLLANLQLRLNAPAQAARIYALLAERDAPHREQWLQQEAKWSLAGGQAERAAQAYAELEQNTADPVQRRQYLKYAFDAYLAAEQGGRAIELLKKRLDTLTGSDADAALLRSGVDVAIAQQNYPCAQALLKRWGELQPDNPELEEKDFSLRLAFNDLDGAWASGHRLLAQRPNDVVLMRKLAQLGEWKGDHDEALDLWIRSLSLQDDPQVHEHAWRLALQLFIFDKGVPLLAQIMDTRQMTDVELDALIYAHESRGTPTQAEAWLRNYLKRYPKHRRAWAALVMNLENTLQFKAESVAWGQFAKHFPLTLEERLQWANTYLHQFDPDSAWTVLDIDNRKIDNSDYWRLRAALAWELNDSKSMPQALERLLAIEGKLDSGNQNLLMAYYRQHDPNRAIKLAMDDWRREPSKQRLDTALQITEDFNRWDLMQQLVEEGKKNPLTADEPDLLAASGVLASHNGNYDQAAAIYLDGIARFPSHNLFRQRLVWLYVDQGRKKELKPLISEWRAVARRDSQLWLPFASANQLLGNTRESLVWYRLFLREKPNEWLVRAAYADALESAGYLDTAQRVRIKLLREAQQGTTPMTPALYATWLRLTAVAVSPLQAQRQALRWQDGSPAMLQLWFERQLAVLDDVQQPKQKDEWLAWARQRHLQVNRFEDMQQVLRSDSREQMAKLLDNYELAAGQRADILNRIGRPGEALQTNLAALGGEVDEQANADLRAQAIGLESAHPQGLSLSWSRQDFGGLTFASPQLNLARNLGHEWYGTLEAEQGRYDDPALDNSVLGQERNLKLGLERALSDGAYAMVLDLSQRDDEDRNGLGISRRWALEAGNELETGLDWHRESSETGFMRALAQRDELWLAGRHTLTSRDQLSWRVGQKRFSTRQGDELGDGQAFSLQLNHTVEFANPTWSVRAGLDYQRYQLNDRSLDNLLLANGGPVDLSRFGTLQQGIVTAQDLMQDRYGQFSVGSTLRRGMPGSMNRSSAQYSWLLDTNLGWQWQDQTFNYGVSAGIGVPVLGGDELAFMAGYQSAPQGAEGKPGGVMTMTYSVRFGR